MFSDGLIHAGSRYGQSMDTVSSLEALLQEEDPSPQMIADDLLEHAMKLDQGRPVDDISVVVLRVTGGVGDAVRRLTVRLPIGQ
jgi:serine phosphatase RsbU (regulator of sigma subunit)